MTDIEELKKRLRNFEPVYRNDDVELMTEAADAIEQLQRNMKENLQREAKDYNELLDEKEKLQRELEEARRDAERYKQLRDADWDNLDLLTCYVGGDVENLQGGALDAKLDAAREQPG